MKEKRFACPNCGQHYAVDPSWNEPAITCSACGREFRPSEPVPMGAATGIPAEGSSLPAAETAGSELEAAGGSRKLFPQVAAVVGVVALVVIGLCLALRASATARHQPRAGHAWTNSLGMVFVPVKGTKLLFCIWETRLQDFEHYVNSGGLAPGAGLINFEHESDSDQTLKQEPQASWKAPGFGQGPTHPVVGVDWADAQAFCRWLTETEQRSGKLGSGQVYRLPTRREIIAAVGFSSKFRDWTQPHLGGPWPAPEVAAVTRNFFPWGNTWPPPKASGNFADKALRQQRPGTAVLDGYEDGFAETAPVGSFQSNKFGLYDLAGNVSELLENQDPGAGADCFGSSWRDVENYAFVSTNFKGVGSGRHDDVGFRCVLMLSGGPSYAAKRPSVQRALTEPSYQGRRLSSWLQEVATQEQPASGQSAEGDGLVLSFPVIMSGDLTKPAQEAVRAMGDAALPWLVKDLLATSRGPIPTTDEQNQAALRGFRALGAAAAPAIPEISPLFDDKDSRWSTSRHCAVLALEAIGPAAVPLLVKALVHPDRETRALAADALAGIGPPAAGAVPLLLKTLKDEEVNTAAAAARALGYIRADAETVVPALIELFTNAPTQVTNRPRSAVVAKKPASVLSKARATVARDSGKVRAVVMPQMAYMSPQARADCISRLRITSADALARYGPADAKSAVPELRLYLKHPAPTSFMEEPFDRAVRRAVQHALAVLEKATPARRS